MSQATNLPPANIELLYSYRHDTHCFTIKEIPGLIVMDWSLRRAYDSAVEGMLQHTKAVYGVQVQYDILDDFTEFEKYKRVRCKLRTVH